MGALRFRAGELALIANPVPGSPPEFIGMVVCIEEVGPFPAFHRWPDGSYITEDADYSIRCSDGDGGHCLDRELKKLQPPDERVETTEVVGEGIAA